MRPDDLQLFIQQLLAPLGQFHLGMRQAGGFFDHRVIAC